MGLPPSTCPKLDHFSHQFTAVIISNLEARNWMSNILTRGTAHGHIHPKQPSQSKHGEYKHGCPQTREKKNTQVFVKNFVKTVT